MRVVTGVGGATVLDLNATPGGGVMAARGGQTWAQTTLTDDQMSDSTSASWWTPLVNPSEVADRRITVPLKVQGTSQNDVAARVSALQQAVDTPWTLEVRRHGATQSGWLRCRPANLQVTATINAVGSSFFADALLTAQTEPYALGAVVDTGDLTFTQDTSVASALYADVNGVPGDALAPTLIRWNLATPVGAGLTTHGSWWAVRRQSPARPTPSNLTGLVQQGEASTGTTLSSGNVTTSVVTGDSALAGSSGRRFTFGAGASVNDTGEARYTFTQSGPDGVGRYRVLGRFRRGGGGAGIQHTITPAFGAYAPQTVTWPAGGVDTRVLDLGLVQLPVGQPVQVAAPLSAPRGGSLVGCRVVVSKNGAAGAGTFDIDWLALVPADEDAGMWRTVQDTACWVFADGYALEPGFSTTDPLSGVSPTLLGMERFMGSYWTAGMPRLAPGSNRIYCVQGVTGAVVWPKTSSVVARVAYWPRYRWLP